MSLGRFRPAHPPDYDVSRKSGKLNWEGYQGTHRATLTLLRPALLGSIGSA